MSAAVHATLFALLWSGVGPVGARGPGSSAASDGSRDEAAAATWEVAETPPAPEADEPVFDATDAEAVPPEEALAPTRFVDDPPPSDLVPAEVDAPADVDAPPTNVETRDAIAPFAPGRAIPRTLATRAVAPPATAPASPPRPTTVAAAAPVSAPHPIVATRAGGGNGVRPPVADPANREPTFPSDALARGDRGRVTLLLRVSADGFVTDVSISQSSGSASLDRAALDAARTWRFRPAMRDDDVAIASSVRRGVNFD